jgi:GDP-mannose 6-dehydrogenase
MLELASHLSGRMLGDSLLGGMNPEFLREGSAVEDFFEPSVVVIGAPDETSSHRIAEIYAGLDGAQFVHLNTREAELVKYANNAFHAIKVTFANEIDRIAESFDIDAKQVMGVVCADRKLNISEKYLRPGFAFGGSCLPKDVRAINRLADVNGVKVPMLESLMRSNSYHINSALEKVNRSGAKRIGLLGLTFKSKTDDVRESPALALASMLLEAGYDLVVNDCNFVPEELIGASRSFIQDEFPELERYWQSSAEDVVLSADLVILTNPEEPYLLALDGVDVEVLDLSKSVQELSSRLV